MEYDRGKSFPFNFEPNGIFVRFIIERKTSLLWPLFLSPFIPNTAQYELTSPIFEHATVYSTFAYMRAVQTNLRNLMTCKRILQENSLSQVAYAR